MFIVLRILLCCFNNKAFQIPHLGFQFQKLWCMAGLWGFQNCMLYWSNRVVCCIYRLWLQFRPAAKGQLLPVLLLCRVFLLWGPLSWAPTCGWVFCFLFFGSLPESMRAHCWWQRARAWQLCLVPRTLLQPAILSIPTSGPSPASTSLFPATAQVWGQEGKSWHVCPVLEQVKDFVSAHRRATDGALADAVCHISCLDNEHLKKLHGNHPKII